MPRRTTAHCTPSPPSRHRILAAPRGTLRSVVGSPSATSAYSWHSSATFTRAGHTPLAHARPMAPASSGSSKTANFPALLDTTGTTPASATWFLNWSRLTVGRTTGEDSPSTSKRARVAPESFRTRIMSAWRNGGVESCSWLWRRDRSPRAASRNALYASAGICRRWPACTFLKLSPIVYVPIPKSEKSPSS